MFEYDSLIQRYNHITMTKIELIKKLKELGYADFYSLDGSLDPDRRILYHNYSKWEYFYFDERGNRDPIKIFLSEEEAYDYIYKDALRTYELLHKDYPSPRKTLTRTVTVHGDNFVMTGTEEIPVDTQTDSDSATTFDTDCGPTD